MFRALGGPAGVRASQEFAEGALLGLAERIAEVSRAVGVAGEPGKRGSTPSSTRGIGCRSCFPDTLVQIAEPFSPAIRPTVPAHAPLDWVPARDWHLWALGFLAITWHDAAVGCKFGQRASGTPVELPIPVPAFITPGAKEPGIVGFLRPVLVLPAQLLEHLNPQQLERHSRARAVPCSPPGQFLRGRSYGGGGDFLVPSAGVVDWIAHG